MSLMRTHGVAIKADEKHCETCGTCVERQEAFELARVPDPTEYEKGCNSSEDLNIFPLNASDDFAVFTKSMKLKG